MDARARAFEEKAKAKFRLRHSFKLEDYRGFGVPLPMVCPTHGAFQRKPLAYLGSSLGCPTCCHESAAAASRKTPEQRLATSRAYIAAHRDLYREAAKKHRERMKRAHPERWKALLAKQNEHRKGWAKTPSGRDHVRRKRQGERAARREAIGPSGGVSRLQWKAICHRYTDECGSVRCAYCFGVCVPTMDHVVPIALGGEHAPSNVVPACGRCNSSKCAHPLSQWLGIDRSSKPA